MGVSVSVQGGLCPEGGFCLGGLCPGGLYQGDPPGRDPPHTATNGRYTFYWNAFLFQEIYFTNVGLYEKHPCHDHDGTWYIIYF